MNPEETDVAGAAEILRIHPESVRRLARQGKLPAWQDGNQWRFDARRLKPRQQRQPAAVPQFQHDDLTDSPDIVENASITWGRNYLGEENLCGYEGLILSIIDRAIRDILAGGPWSADGLAYFNSHWYQQHLTLLGLPDDALPTILRR